MTWEEITEIIDAYETDPDAALEKYGEESVDTAKMWAEVIDEHDEEIAEAAFELDVQPADVDEAYAGKWPSDEAFAQNLLEETGGMPKDLPSYIHIDWERTAHDLMMDYGEHNGYYFRSL